MYNELPNSELSELYELRARNKDLIKWQRAAMQLIRNVLAELNASPNQYTKDAKLINDLTSAILPKTQDTDTTDLIAASKHAVDVLIKIAADSQNPALATIAAKQLANEIANHRA